MIQEFKKYYEKAKMMQELKYQGASWTEQDINDDLIWNVPIYDVVNRRYAAFSSLLEALIYGDKDPKNNGIYFKNVSLKDSDFIALAYLFRLCGSGINYKPKKQNDEPFGSHGFGNFWVVNEIRNGNYDFNTWINNIPNNNFCDVKGYLLPMISGGLRNFIVNESKFLIDYLINYVFETKGQKNIKDIVDKGNAWLLERKYKRQNFVLTAFAMDLAEYFPDNVNRDSDVYIGTNAKKCLKLILPYMNNDKALKHLCNITGNFSKKYDMEDVACDFIRYLDNFQSEDHIKNNNNIKYQNNVSKQTNWN